MPSAFPDIRLPSRSAKPRTSGLTMVLDKNMGLHALTDLLDTASSSIDLVKFGWGTSAMQDESLIRRKCAALAERQIMCCPGGTLTELAWLQGSMTSYLNQAKALGFSCIEVSNGTVPIPQAQKLDMIKQALDMGKEVFAIPGSIHTTVAKGCHDLIKQGAKLVDCAQDILEELKDLPILVEKSTATEISESASDSDVEAALLAADDQTRKVLDHLGHDPVGLDELQMRSGLPTAQLQAELFQLELNGALGRLPGGLYQKLKRASTRHPRAF